MEKRKKVLLFFSISLLTLAALVVTLFLFEGMYRMQWVDTYHSEFRNYNDSLDIEHLGDKPKLLLMGDSFTGKQDYPLILRKLQSEYTVINGGVGGTGIHETNVMAPGRFKKKKTAKLV
jgi:hypothetical protein